MSELRFLISIVRRERAEEFLAYYRQQEVPLVLSFLCTGTAKQTMLDRWGWESRERTGICALLRQDKAKALMRGLVWDKRLDAPNEGIAVTIRVDGANDTNDIDEVNNMQQTPYAMIVAIAERGHSQLVMDSARAVGATGGTIVHAKGTGSQIASKFFGVTIADEKDMIFIIAAQADKQPIMNAIREGAGKSTPAKAVVFAMPVDSVTGLFGAQR